MQTGINATSWPTVVLLAALFGCGDGQSADQTTSSGGGGQSASTSSTGGGGGTPGAVCMEQQSQSDCEALSCDWVTGRLFSPPSDCSDMTPISVCIEKLDVYVFDQTLLFYRDTDAGRVVVAPEDGNEPELFGYTQCEGCVSGSPCDWCKCAAQ